MWSQYLPSSQENWLRTCIEGPSPWGGGEGHSGKLEAFTNLQDLKERNASRFIVTAAEIWRNVSDLVF